MTATAIETKQADEAAAVSAPDAADVDALLAQADALAEEVTQAVGDASQPEAGASTQVEVEPAEPAVLPDESDKLDQNVNPSTGIASTLDDLDNLLEELGEKPSAEPQGQPVDRAAIEVAAGPSPIDGGADPQADEVARIEAPSAGDSAGGGETVLEEAAPAFEQTQAAAAADVPDEAPIERPQLFPARIAYSLAAPVAGALGVIDIPFARLGPRIKNILGYVALATLVVAAGLWLAGPFLVHR